MGRSYSIPIVKANEESCACSSMKHPANKDKRLVGRTDRIGI